MGWMDEYEDGGQFGGLTNKGFNYNGAWGGPAQRGATLKAYKEQDYLDRFWDIVSNPLTSFGYAARNESIPKYLGRGIKSGAVERNVLDNPLDIVNPIYYANSAGRGAERLLHGDLRGTALEAINFLPTMKLAPGAGRLVKNANKLKLIGNTVGETDAFMHATTGKDLSTPEPKKKQSGGGIPGSVGFSYARTGAPSNGKYAKKTMPSAEDGLEIIEDDMGQWAHPGKITKINSNRITMKNVDYPVIGVSDTGDKKLMKPGKNYKFKGNSVTEFPLKSKDGSQLIKLDQLTNFTNYNKPQPGGWLDKL